MLAGCDPKVVSDMYTYEFAPLPADSVPEFKNKQDDRPENVLRVAVGPSWLVSKFETYRRVYKKKDGLDITADYAHVWKSGFGVGVSVIMAAPGMVNGVQGFYTVGINNSGIIYHRCFYAAQDFYRSFPNSILP